jgi:tRNA threonylcarbamoyladenosine biosynthesis protein TsaE
METREQRVFVCAAPADLDRAAASILALTGGPRVLALVGPLGAGKTTLVKAFCRLLGVTSPTASPSFALLYEYEAPGRPPVYHFDCYRIASESEMFDLGYEQYFYSGSYCFVEWADRVPALLPPGCAAVRFRVDGRQRTLTYTE